MQKMICVKAGYKTTQSGASLIVALIMLLLLTIVGMSAMQGSVIEEKMAGNMRDGHQAFHSAEIALDYAEKWIHGQLNEPDKSAFPCPTGQTCEVFDSYNYTYTAGTSPTDKVTSSTTTGVSDWQNNSITYANNALTGTNPRAATTIAGVSTQPRMLIEYDDFKRDSFISGTTAPVTGDTHYRTTVQAAGAGNNSEAIVQTVFVKRFN